MEVVRSHSTKGRTRNLSAWIRYYRDFGLARDRMGPQSRHWEGCLFWLYKLCYPMEAIYYRPVDSFGYYESSLAFRWREGLVIHISKLRKDRTLTEGHNSMLVNRVRGAWTFPPTTISVELRVGKFLLKAWSLIWQGLVGRFACSSRLPRFIPGLQYDMEASNLKNI